MTNVIDWILDLFRDPVQAQAFINDPDRSMQNAGLANVTAAQVQAVAATVAPAAVIQGGGDPVYGLQQAVAETHGIAFTPQYAPTFGPDTQAFSDNETLSNNDPHILSPDAGHDVQQGGVNLDFGDITFGDKNTASDGSVINTGNAGDIDNTNVHGHGNVVGDGNVGANTGDILAGDGSTVQAGGVGNASDSHGSVTNTGGGDVISGNEGPVVKTGNIDASGGGAAGGSGGHGGGILSGGGGGGNAAGGAGGTVVIAPSQTTTTDTHGGGITSVDTHGGNIGGDVDASHHDDNSAHVDNSTHDSSLHVDNSVHQQVDTHVDPGIHLGF
ncbi:MAG: hypothetical protein QOC63_1902 [Mycobacterium sp.]|nr:hypothetical protein [Mycobacterium sp.]